MPAIYSPENKITKYIPPEIVNILKGAGVIAARKGYKLYLVGGIVRDMFLERTNTDIDLAIEGNAVELAKTMPVKDTKYIINENFGTAKIKFTDFHIDLAMTRTELYKKPGALPIVMPSDILKDLLRRDFTINAMAISLNPENYGELIDPYKGTQDIKKKLVRVLHDNSFVDDATRIWRAVRYAERLGFTIETQTMKLIQRDIRYLSIISGERIRHELERTLSENQPEKILKTASGLHVLEQIHPKMCVNDKLAEEFEKARELGLSEASLYTVYIALLIFPLNQDDLEQVASYLRFKKSLTDILRETLQLKTTVHDLDRKQISPSKIYFTLNKFSEQSIIVNSLVTNSIKIEQNIDLYLTRLRHVKSRLNGNDLKRMGIQPGPHIKEILQILQAAKLDGKVTTKQGEIRLIGLPYDSKNNQQKK